MGKTSDRIPTDKKGRPSWSEAVIKALPDAPTGKRQVYHHPSIPSLVVIVSAKTRTFYFQARIERRYERIHIGRFPAISPGAAVDLAKGIAEAIARGENPAQAKRDKRAGETLKEYWRGTFNPLHVSGLKPTTSATYRTLWRKYISPKLGNLLLKELTRADVKRVHAAIGKEKKRTANQALAVLRSLLSHALDQERIESNVAMGIRQFKENKRERYLTLDEVARLYKAIEDYTNATMNWAVHDMVKLALLTGQRATNIVEARWRDVDLRGRVWRIPGDVTKTGEAHSVHLVEGAVRIFESRLKQAEDGAEYVFPHHKRPGEPETRFWLANRWEIVRKAAGLEDVRFHDLRHSSATRIANCGGDLQVVGRQLGHRDMASSYRYAHVMDETVARIVDLAMADIEALDKKK